MVKRTEKERATQYICDSLEDSGLYTIMNKDHESVLVKRDNENETNIEVVIPNFLGAARNYTQRINRNSREQKFTCPVLYKDRKTTFVRLVDNNSWRTEESLKKYSSNEINRMIGLRKIEKYVMEHIGNNLTYYQPKSDRLSEKILEIYLNPVNLDYSHIDRNHRSFNFANNRVSTDYKLPQENGIIEPAAKFINTRKHYIARLSSAIVEPSRLLNIEHCQQELFERTKDCF